MLKNIYITLKKKLYIKIKTIKKKISLQYKSKQNLEIIINAEYKICKY